MEAKLVVVGGKATHQRIRLKLPTIVGREQTAGLVVSHPTVSRKHCEIIELNGGLVVRDFGSANGTLIGQERITEAILRPGDEITIGPLTFRADYEPEVEISTSTTLEQLKSGKCPKRPKSAPVKKPVKKPPVEVDEAADTKPLDEHLPPGVKSPTAKASSKRSAGDEIFDFDFGEPNQVEDVPSMKFDPTDRSGAEPTVTSLDDSAAGAEFDPLAFLTDEATSPPTPVAKQASTTAPVTQEPPQTESSRATLDTKEDAFDPLEFLTAAAGATVALPQAAPEPIEAPGAESVVEAVTEFDPLEFLNTPGSTNESAPSDVVEPAASASTPAISASEAFDAFDFLNASATEERASPPVVDAPVASDLPVAPPPAEPEAAVDPWSFLSDSPAKNEPEVRETAEPMVESSEVIESEPLDMPTAMFESFEALDEAPIDVRAADDSGALAASSELERFEPLSPVVESPSTAEPVPAADLGALLNTSLPTPATPENIEPVATSLPSDLLTGNEPNPAPVVVTESKPKSAGFYPAAKSTVATEPVAPSTQKSAVDFASIFKPQPAAPATTPITVPQPVVEPEPNFSAEPIVELPSVDEPTLNFTPNESAPAAAEPQWDFQPAANRVATANDVPNFELAADTASASPVAEANFTFGNALSERPVRAPDEMAPTAEANLSEEAELPAIAASPASAKPTTSVKPAKQGFLAKLLSAFGKKSKPAAKSVASKVAATAPIVGAAAAAPSFEPPVFAAPQSSADEATAFFEPTDAADVLEPPPSLDSAPSQEPPFSFEPASSFEPLSSPPDGAFDFLTTSTPAEPVQAANDDASFDFLSDAPESKPAQPSGGNDDLDDFLNQIGMK